MTILEQILNKYADENFMTVEGFDSAVIGLEDSSFILIYSVSKCLNILQKDMSQEDALEYLYHNCVGTFVGEKTPIWSYDLFDIDLDKSEKLVMRIEKLKKALKLAVEMREAQRQYQEGRKKYHRVRMNYLEKKFDETAQKTIDDYKQKNPKWNCKNYSIYSI